MGGPRVVSGHVRALGHRLYYTSLGKPEKGTVLALHGGPGFDHHYLLPLFDLAPIGYRVVLYDQLGCGGSDRLEGANPYSFEQAAEEVEAVRRGLGLGRVHLLGHSFGAALALEAVARHPAAFRSLVLASGLVAPPAVIEREFTRLVNALPTDVRRFFNRENPDIDDSFEPTKPGTFVRHRPLYQEFWRRHFLRGETVPWELALSESTANRRVTLSMWASLANWRGSGRPYDVSAAYSAVRVPSLITVGRHDELPPAISRYALRSLPKSRLVIFERSAHMPHWEEREKYILTLRDFLGSVR